MNDRFFGDERDFHKYGLLRALARGGFRIGVCWLLTKDCRNGGGNIGYLSKGKLRHKDEYLFDLLYDCVCVNGQRDVRLMKRKFEGEFVIPGTSYCENYFSGEDQSRERYFNDMIEKFKSVGLIFLDPDTGFIPKSRPSKPLDEYVKYSELKDCHDRIGRASFMVFQYYRLEFESDQIQKQHRRTHGKLKAIAPNARICTVWKKPVAYYFIINPIHDDKLWGMVKQAADHFGFKVK